MSKGNKITFPNSNYGFVNAYISGDFAGGGIIDMYNNNTTFNIGGKASGNTNFVKRYIREGDIKENKVYFIEDSKDPNSRFSYTSTILYLLENMHTNNREEWKIIKNNTLVNTAYVDGTYTGVSNGTQMKPFKTLEDDKTH